jgi:hypothetical protein
VTGRASVGEDWLHGEPLGRRRCVGALPVDIREPGKRKDQRLRSLPAAPLRAEGEVELVSERQPWQRQVETTCLEERDLDVLDPARPCRPSPGAGQ